MTTQVLMCAPRFIPAISQERSWSSQALDPALARNQWDSLRALVAQHIGPVVEVEAEPWTRALTFTRDLGLVVGETIVPLMPVSGRGPFEAPLVHKHVESLGYTLATTERPLRFDGGNVLADCHGRLLIGLTGPTPSEDFVAAVRFMEAATDRRAYRLPITGGRFPHIDMAVSDLNGKAWLVYPGALIDFDLADPAWREIFQGRPVLVADEQDGELLGCNLIVAGDLAMGPVLSHDLRSRIEAAGIDYLGTPLGELRKAGGGAHCLTLELPAR